MNSSSSLPPVRTRHRPSPLRVRSLADPNDGNTSADRLVANAPVHGRKKRTPNSGSFKKGEPSRNPKGRPKGAKGKKSVVRKVLLENVTVRLPSGSKRLSVLEALLLKERDLAFSGDWRARKTLFELGRWALPEDALEAAGVLPATEADTDRAIIAWFEEELRQKDEQAKGAK